MQVSPSKENILKKIRKALTHSTPLPFPGSEGNNPVFQAAKEELEVEFAAQFTRLMGKFIYCADHRETILHLTHIVQSHKWTKVYCREEQLQQILKTNGFSGYEYDLLDSCDVAITTCELLIARTGSILLSSAQTSGRTPSVYAPVHICIAYTDQVVYDIREALQAMKDKYKTIPSLITFASGPSRTADIEKTLVVGVHGPAEVYVLLIEAGSKTQLI
ncbi:MAG TPA: LUD domain-containing protein [Flavitalea sp.]|nr:LUD domain-containing protein [Flavitalea sp.]